METIAGNAMPTWAAVLVIIFGAASLLVTAYTLASTIRSLRVVKRIEKQVEELKHQDIRNSNLSELQALTERLEELRNLNSQEGEKVSITLRWIAAAGGLIGMSFLIRYGYKMIEGLNWSSVIDLNFPTKAMAAEGAKTQLEPFLPFIAMAVLALMGVAFIVALGALLVLKDTKENQASIKAADNIVKTFGGFFTGLATTLIH